ncbi:cell division protein FtsZ [Alteraurantiacibacter aquimixticola]|uniref:Cell division protein FtsZ n=1 Tax=Alteraurantiacibacter aquimixticola TaxID=2489173 RepID=A0A4T3F8P2_9SPHN|nr:cell division protein FtsZ [Alteraurantiacibacter aquimixticola]TIX51380.1 cell division protein FtsZ [Alteraurantiacibacter aquimixticola]
MSINIGPPSVEELRPRITVIGVGGAGGNAIANMIQSEIEGVDFIVANTDAQALNNAVAEHRIQLGPDITQGLGAGSRPEVGRAAAEETVEDIERALEGVNMVFIAAGMGGGTGTGAAPVIAETARKKGILTVGVVTKPFLFEGTRRMRAAEAGIDELQKHVDTLIVIPNQNLFLVAKAETTFKEAFQLADEVLQQGVRSITDLMVMPGLINLDFADIRSVMNEMGKAMMGTGEGEGENRALEAAERAIANPLLDGVSMQGAKGVIISIIGGEDMKLLEVDEAANHIRELVDPEANIIWGSAFNPDLDGRIRVSVVATGIEQSAEQAHSASQPLNLGASRGPKKPVLPMQSLEEDDAAEDALDEATTLGGPDVNANRVNTEFSRPFSAPKAVEEEEEPLDLGHPEIAAEAPEVDFSRPSSDAPTPAPAEDDEFGPGKEEGFASLSSMGRAAAKPQDDGHTSGEMFELTEEVAEGSDTADAEEEEELLLDASRLAGDGEPEAAESAPRKRRFFGGGSDDAEEVPAEAPQPASAAGGSTLFERMANLSRHGEEGEAEGEGEDGDDAPAMRIPRFLGRQNNQ